MTDFFYVKKSKNKMHFEYNFTYANMSQHAWICILYIPSGNSIGAVYSTKIYK